MTRIRSATKQRRRQGEWTIIIFLTHKCLHATYMTPHLPAPLPHIPTLPSLIVLALCVCVNVFVYFCFGSWLLSHSVWAELGSVSPFLFCSVQHSPVGSVCLSDLLRSWLHLQKVSVFFSPLRCNSYAECAIVTVFCVYTHPHGDTHRRETLSYAWCEGGVSGGRGSMSWCWDICCPPAPVPSLANRVDCRLGRPGSVIVFVLARELREFWAK